VIRTGTSLEHARLIAEHLADPDPAFDTARELALRLFPDLLETIAYWETTCEQLAESLPKDAA
jgi:hypothetical protein